MRLALCRVLLIGAAGYLALMPIALATPFTFTLSGASTVLSGIGETITGSFTFDAATLTESAVSITLSGATPYSGTYTTDPVAPQPAFVVTAMDLSTSNRIELFFQFPLAFSPDPLTLVFWQDPTEFSMGRGEIDSHPLGAAVSPDAPAPIPEPASLALFASAVAATFWFTRRRGSKARQLSDGFVLERSKAMSEAAGHKRRSAAQEGGDLKTAVHKDAQARQPDGAATTPTCSNTVTVRLADGSSLTFIGRTEALGSV